MRPIFAIFNFLRGLKTTKFHEVPAGTAVKMYGEDSNGDLIKDDVPSGGGATAFTDLSDVPQSYTDQAGKMLVVNEDEDALEFTDVTETHTHTNKDILDGIIDSGDGDEFLADDGTYKAIETGLQYFSEYRNAASPNSTIPAHQLIAKGTETNIDIILSPKGNSGAIIRRIPDGSHSGGNKRGAAAVDLQSFSSYNDEVASGSYSFIGSGFQNKATGTCSVVTCGAVNYATNNYTTICGGQHNTASGSNASIVGGESNLASGDHSGIINGYHNIASGNYATASGARAKAMFAGQTAHASGRFAAVGDAQRSDYVLRGNVLTTNYYRLYLDGSSALIDLSQTGAYSTWNCKLKVTGLRRLTGSIDHFVSEHNFMIYRENSTPVIADFTEIHTYQVGGSSVATTVSIATNSLAIDIATTESDWQFVAHLETVETFSGSLV